MIWPILFLFMFPNREVFQNRAPMNSRAKDNHYGSIKEIKKRIKSRIHETSQTGGRLSNQKCSQRKSIAWKQFESRRSVKQSSLYAQDRKPSQQSPSTGME